MAGPGLAKQRVIRHLEKIEATGKGHMRQQQQNVRSTSQIEKPKIPKDEYFKEESITKSNLAFTKIHSLTEEIHTDQTGKFTIWSSANNQYLCICYDYDSNSIIAKSIPTRKQGIIGSSRNIFY